MCADLGEEGRVGLPYQTVGLFEARHRQQQVGVVGASLRHQIIEGRILEQGPPLLVHRRGAGLGGGLRLGEALGQGRVGTLVVGPHGTPCQQQGGGEGGSQGFQFRALHYWPSLSLA
ncbi:hypothetical protein SDC9_126051 [bioreactor metagenome]|uniref:Uncharacterized protein n=1 Tax=bioreactor metagenome TaxID=1076179 RepID=A0A645CQ56_9ZZZZ